MVKTDDRIRRLQRDRVDRDARLLREREQIVERHEAGGIVAVGQHRDRLAADSPSARGTFSICLMVV